MYMGSWTARRAVLLAGVALGCSIGCAGAQAAGFALKEQSAIDQGASYAGAAARADDPSTLFFNPAGITKLPGYQISISGSLIMPQSTLESGSASFNTPFGTLPLGGTTGQDAAETVLLPSFYATAEITPDWHVGLAVTSPFGLTTKYDTPSVARYYALTSNLRTYNITPSVAWQVVPQLSVSAGLQIQVANANLSQAVNYGAIGLALNPQLAALGYAPGKKDGIASVKGNDTAVGWQVGLLYEPLTGTRLGFDYRSPIFHNLTGDVTTQAPYPLPSTVSNGAAKLVTPDTFSFAVAQDVGDFTLLGSVDYTLWSRFKQLLVTSGGPDSLTQENWNNSVMVSVGADWRVAQQWTLRAGLAYDQTPVDNSFRTPRIPDNNRYWLSLGATWKPIPKLAISAAYSHIFVPSSSVNLVDLGPGTPNYLRGNLSATYDNQINIVSLQGTLAF